MTIDERTDGKLTLRIDKAALDTRSDGASFGFFPRDSGVVDEGEDPEIVVADDHLEIRLVRGANAPPVPVRFGGLLVVDAAGRERTYDLGPATVDAATTRRAGRRGGRDAGA